MVMSGFSSGKSEARYIGEGTYFAPVLNDDVLFNAHKQRDTANDVGHVFFCVGIIDHPWEGSPMELMKHGTNVFVDSKEAPTVYAIRDNHVVPLMIITLQFDSVGKRAG